MEKLYYSISETAELVGENATTIRFWANSFPKFVSPRRNAKGNRQFTAKDLEALRRIKYLTRECGLNLEAVSRKMSDTDPQDNISKVRSTLSDIRAELLKVKESL